MNAIMVQGLMRTSYNMLGESDRSVNLHVDGIEACSSARTPADLEEQDSKGCHDAYHAILSSPDETGVDRWKFPKLYLVGS